MQNPGPEVGRAVLKAFLSEKSPLGPLRVMAGMVGRFFQIPLPFFKPYVVFGPQAARQVLVTDRNKLRWRNPDPVTDLLRQGVLVTDGAEHDHYRSIMEPSLHPAELPRYTAMMQRQVERVSALWPQGGTVDMLVEGRKIALLIVMEALFGVDFWDDLPRLWTPILKAIEYISPGPWILWRKLPRPGYRRHLKALDDYLYALIATRRQSPAQPDLLQHLIDAGLPDERIRDQMLTMLIAGHDTSTALLAWVFALLGQNPQTMTRLVAALDESAPGQHPHLLDEVIKEALRLYPPIHIGNRMVAADLDFGAGQTIAAGERMFYSIYLTHRDPQVWDAPDQFCPERFEHGRKTPPMSYIPFGGGPRACIGAAFGQAEARIVIAHLLQTYDFQLTNPHIHTHMGATLEPRPGVRMKVHKRATPNKPIPETVPQP